MKRRRVAYFSGFPSDVSKEELLEFLTSNLGDIKIKKVTITKKRTLCIVQFSDREGLRRSCKILNEEKFKGKEIYFSKRPNRSMINEMILSERDWVVTCFWIRKRYLKLDAAFRTTIDERTSLLHLAVLDEDLKSVVEIILAGIDINVKDSNGRTPVHYACMFGRILSLKILINRGSDINIADNKLNTPLHYASAHGFNRHIELIVRSLGDLKGPPRKNVRDKTPEKIWEFDTIDIFKSYEQICVGNRIYTVVKSDRAHALLFCRDPKDGVIKVLLKKQKVKSYEKRSFYKKLEVMIDEKEYIFVLYFFEALFQYYILVKNPESDKIFYSRDVPRHVWKHFFQMESPPPKLRNAFHYMKGDVGFTHRYETFLKENKVILMLQRKIDLERLEIRKKENVDFCLYLPGLDLELFFFREPTWGEFICEFDVFKDVKDIKKCVARAVSAQTYGSLSHHMQKRSREKLIRIIETERESMVQNVPVSYLLKPFFLIKTDYIKMDDLDLRHYTGKEEFPIFEFKWFPIDDVFKMMKWGKNVDGQDRRKHILERKNREEQEEVEGELDTDTDDDDDDDIYHKEKSDSISSKRGNKDGDDSTIPKNLVEFINTCEKIPYPLQRMKNFMIFPYRVWEKILYDYCDMKSLCSIRGACSLLRDISYQSKSVVFDEFLGHPKLLLTYFLQAKSITIANNDGFEELVFHHISQNVFLKEIRILFDISPISIEKVSKVLVNNVCFETLCLRDCRHLSSFGFLHSILGLNSKNKSIRCIELGGVFQPSYQHALAEVLVGSKLMTLSKLILWDIDVIGMYQVWCNFIALVRVRHLVLNLSDIEFATIGMERYSEMDWVNLEQMWEGVFYSMERNLSLIEVSSNIPSLHVIRRRTNVLQNVTINVPRECMTPQEIEEERLYLEKKKNKMKRNYEQHETNSSSNENEVWEEEEDEFEGLDENAVYFDSSSDEDLNEREFLIERGRKLKRMEDFVSRQRLKKKISMKRVERDRRIFFSVLVILIAIVNAFLFYREF